MFSKSSLKKRTTAPSIITQSLVVPVVSYSAAGESTSFKSAASNSIPATTGITNEDLVALDGGSKRRIEGKRRRRSFLASSRLSLYSLFYPGAAYSNRRPLPSMSQSVNDIHNTSNNVSAALGPSSSTAAPISEIDTGGVSVVADTSSTSCGDKDSLAPSFSGATRECPLCCVRQHLDIFPLLKSCSHRSCRSCLIQYLQTEILESRVSIACPECNEMMHPNDIHSLLANYKQLLDKYEEFSVRRVLMIDPDTRWCPAPDCGFAVIATGCAACPELKCDRTGCNTLFCYHCKMVWHPNQTCNEARAQRGSFAHNILSFETTIKKGDVKSCPRCLAPIVKADDGSCNHMICSICGAEFCWLCMKEISDLHYLSPSGCTFWAKKQWSRKKKLIWQLGMLVGAPVGIALVAGFAVPAIMFGVPVWIGRKVHTKLKTSSKTKRRIAVTFSVAGSVLMGPALATMAVGVGVPIMLAYVYGVVPLSLCRNGSCGVTASPSGVRLDIDSDLFEMNDNADGVSQEKTQLLTNVDRSDAITITSARSGSTMITHHKIQVHAEMAYAVKRRPSIESGAISLGDRQNYEDASVKALGGSVYYDDKSVHTMGSLVEGGSYCEHHASTKALAGSAICPPTVACSYVLPNSDSKSACCAAARSHEPVGEPMTSHAFSECRSSVGSGGAGGVRFAFTTASSWRESMTRLTSGVDDSDDGSAKTSGVRDSTATAFAECAPVLDFADLFSVDSVDVMAIVQPFMWLDTGSDGSESTRAKTRSSAPYFTTSSSRRLSSIGESSPRITRGKDASDVMIRIDKNHKSASWSHRLDSVSEPLLNDDVSGKVSTRPQSNNGSGEASGNARYKKRSAVVEVVGRHRHAAGNTGAKISWPTGSAGPRQGRGARSASASYTSLIEIATVHQPVTKPSDLPSTSSAGKKWNSLATTLNNLLFRK